MSAKMFTAIIVALVVIAGVVGFMVFQKSNTPEIIETRDFSCSSMTGFTFKYPVFKGLENISMNQENCEMNIKGWLYLKNRGDYTLVKIKIDKNTTFSLYETPPNKNKYGISYDLNEIESKLVFLLNYGTENYGSGKADNLVIQIIPLPVKQGNISGFSNEIFFQTIIDSFKPNDIYEFTKVNDLTENPDSGFIASFKTDTGEKVWIEYTEPENINTDINFLRRATKEKKVVFVAYKPMTHISRFVTPFTKDYVDSFDYNQSTTIMISMVLRPSPFFLLSTHPHFQELRALLEIAKKENRLIWIGTFPGDSEILDVRFP